MSDQLALEETLTILTNAQLPFCAAFVQAQAAELERLATALEPFAAYAALCKPTTNLRIGYYNPSPTEDDCRAARAALAEAAKLIK